MWNKKVLVVSMQWDYCDKSRGVSMDKLWFFDNISKLVSQAEAFWYDEYVNSPALLRKLLLEKVETYKPDLIFYPTYTDQLDAAILEKLGKISRTCAWFGDDAWRFETYPARIAKYFTHVVTTDIFSVSKYKALGITPIVSQWAAQPIGSGEMPLPPDRYDYDVSFVGGYNRYRSWYIEKLRAAGIKISSFGQGWSGGKVSAAEMGTIFYKSRINLNLSNSVSQDIRYIFSSPRAAVTYFRSPKRAEQIKARNFEIPASGGFQLTNYAAGIERYFRIGDELAVFSSPEECLLQIKYYLENDAERLSVLLAGSRRARAEHTYEARMREILGTIWG